MAFQPPSNVTCLVLSHFRAALRSLQLKNIEWQCNEITVLKTIENQFGNNRTIQSCSEGFIRSSFDLRNPSILSLGLRAGPEGMSYSRATLFGTGPRFGKAWSKPMPQKTSQKGLSRADQQQGHACTRMLFLELWNHGKGQQAILLRCTPQSISRKVHVIFDGQWSLVLRASMPILALLSKCIPLQ